MKDIPLGLGSVLAKGAVHDQIICLEIKHFTHILKVEIRKIKSLHHFCVYTYSTHIRFYDSCIHKCSIVVVILFLFIYFTITRLSVKLQQFSDIRNLYKICCQSFRKNVTIISVKEILV